MGEVDGWLSSGIVSIDNPNVDNFSGSNTRHYVNKVMRAFDKYKALDERK